MFKEIDVKPYCFMQPVIMIATYNEDGTSNVMNAAWGNSIDYDKFAICIAANHKTWENIIREKACSVAFATKEYVKEADYFGIVSGNQVQSKVASANMTSVECSSVHAPMIKEFKMALECQLLSYDQESEIMIFEIKKVVVEDSILTDGKIDVTKLQPICYDSGMHRYFAIGEVVGSAFKDGKKLIK